MVVIGLELHIDQTNICCSDTTVHKYFEGVNYGRNRRISAIIHI